MNIAINGFGRIGRAVFKSFLEKKLPVKIVAINDLSDNETLAHLLKYDSVYGQYNKKISYAKDSISVAGKKYKIFAERDPENLPWKELEVDIVLECTGLFRTRETVKGHLRAGAKKIMISAPAKSDGFKTVVMGVNENKLKKTDKLISNASCTTNCLAPVTNCIRETFGVKKAIMTTIHAYTSDQNLIDGPHKDQRRARSAALNMIPTSTGAAIATIKTIPSLKDKFDGMAVRVPTPVGSLCDIVFVINKKANVVDINKCFRKAARSAQYRGIIEATDEPIVSTDIVGRSASAIVDMALTKVVDNDLVKVIAWYDNEWGYASRMVDLVEYMRKKKMV